jgi:uncharacterized metal-binding protein YceD (DUF177 family)
MSTFEIELEDFDQERLDVDLEASGAEVRELFEAFEEDFRVQTPEEFVIDLDAVLDGSTVLLTGRVTGKFTYECGRCLTDRSLEVDGRVDVKLLARDEWDDIYMNDDEVALEAEDLNTSWYEGAKIDVSQYIRDAVVMELPQWPHCPDELREECDAAYEEHVGDKTLEQMDHNEPDLRWWPLREIDLEEGDQENEEESNQNS